MTTLRPLGRSIRLANDQGSATGWAIGVVVIGLLLAGLVFDGGAAMSAKAAALNTAQQAARAGADQIDLATLRAAGTVQLNPAAAQAAAAQFLDHAGASGAVTATTEQVVVTVTVTQSAVLLSAAGVTSYELSATATAQPTQT
jgi:Flp pilus assembly protein TadG